MPLTPIHIKIYTAIMNATGETAPTITILHNTIGDIVWTRNATGDWSGTLPGAFDPTKTAVFTQIQANAHMAGTAATSDYISITQTTNDGTPYGEVVNAYIEIRTYTLPITEII